MGKAPSERPAFEPYRGKPAVRNDRGDRGNVGIIRSPIRASILPDHLAARAVDLLVKVLGAALLACHRGDDETRIGFALRPLGFGDDPAPAAPARSRYP